METNMVTRDAVWTHWLDWSAMSPLWSRPRESATYPGKLSVEMGCLWTSQIFWPALWNERWEPSCMNYLDPNRPYNCCQWSFPWKWVTPGWVVINKWASLLNGSLKGMTPQDLSPFKEPWIPSLSVCHPRYQLWFRDHTRSSAISFYEWGELSVWLIPLQQLSGFPCRLPSPSSQTTMCWYIFNINNITMVLNDSFTPITRVNLTWTIILETESSISDLQLEGKSFIYKQNSLFSYHRPFAADDDQQWKRPSFTFKRYPRFGNWQRWSLMVFF